MEAEHFCSIVVVSIPFLLFETLIVEKVRVSYCDVSEFIFVMLWVKEQRVQIPWEVLVVSPRLQADYRLHVLESLRILTVWLLVVHNAFNCCLPSCWSAGSGLFGQWTSLHFLVVRCVRNAWEGDCFLNSHCALRFYVQCVSVVICNTF